MKRGRKRKGKYLSHRAIQRIKQLLDGYYLKHGSELAKRKKRYHRHGRRKIKSFFNVRF